VSAALPLTIGEGKWRFPQTMWQHIQGATETSANERNFQKFALQIISLLTLLDLIEETVIQRYSFNNPNTEEKYRLTDSAKKMMMYVKILRSEEHKSSQSTDPNDV
jgi:hypothetical protein